MEHIEKNYIQEWGRNGKYWNGTMERGSEQGHRQNTIIPGIIGLFMKYKS